MTTATIRNSVRHADPQGIERLAVLFGLALVKWGRVRAERAAVSRDRHAALLGLQQSNAEREHAAHRYGIAG